MNEVLVDRQQALVEAMLHRLSDEGALPRPCPTLDWAEFAKLHKTIGDNFALGWTALSLTMCRMFFGLASAKRPSRSLILGSHEGFAAAWLFGVAGEEPSFAARLQLGVCIDPNEIANAAARRNLGALGHGQHIQVMTTTGQRFLESNDQRFDLVLLDIDDPVSGKAGYVELVLMLAPHLNDRALVLAHDPLVPKFADDMDRFHGLVERSTDYRGPWVLPVDECGLTVAVRDG